MVLFNHSTRELTAKIVYYGPGLCGKTTNLRLLHEKLDPGTTGRLLSLSTAQDRTIYFDLLPVELGNVKGYTVRFQLCTVPGQVFYNETRKLVLKGVDGIVFVVDSQWSMLSHNLESFQNLRENMKELGQGFEETAVVVQYNKRDLPGVLSVQALQESLGFQDYPYVESVAADAKGVVETFKLVSKLTFVQLLKRLQRSPDGERLGPDWVAPTPPSSQATARIPSVGAELLALASSVGPSPAPPADSPFETTASWPGLAKGEVFGDATIPPFTVEPPAAPPELPAAPTDEDDTFREPPGEGLPLPPEPAAVPPPPAPDAAGEGAPSEAGAPPADRAPAGPEPPTLDAMRESGLEPSWPLLAVAETAEPLLAPEPPPAPPAAATLPPPPPPPPAPETPAAPPATAVWAEAFAGLSGRIDELARIRTEEAERLAALAREAREAVSALPETMRGAMAGLAPAAAVEALREALEGHTAEVRPRLLALVEEAARQREAAFERERAQDDAARDAARRHREEIRGDVERAAAAVRELVEALDGKVDGLRAALEDRLGAVERRLEAIEGAASGPEASGKLEEIRHEASEARRLLEAGREDAAAARRADGERLEELRREASEVRRLVEAKLEEAGSQSRRLTGLLRRALEELEPRDGG